MGREEWKEMQLERKTWSDHVGHGMAQNGNLILSVVGCHLLKTNNYFFKTKIPTLLLLN